MSSPSALRIIWTPSGPQVVTSATPVTLPVEVGEGKAARWVTTGYTALTARPATPAEVEAWRNADERC